MSPFYGEADLDAMFADPLAVDVTLLTSPAVVTRGHFDVGDESYAPQDGTIGGLVGTARLRIHSGTLGAGLVVGALVQVNAVTYRVQQIKQTGSDGATQELSLAQN